MKEQKKGIWSIIGLVALVVVLFLGVKIAFAGLDLAIGQNQPEVVRQPLSTESGGDSQWMLLTKSEDNDEVKQWLQKADRGDQAYWLERQEAVENGQLLIFQDFRSDWEGEQIRVVLDGRELTVQKFIATGGELYWSSED